MTFPDKMASSDIAQRIDQEIASTPVMMYSKSGCPFCISAKQALSGIGVRFTAIELDRMPEGPAIQNALQRKTGQRTVPNIFIGGDHVGGCSELQGGLRNGQVQGLLQKHQIAYNH